MQNAERVILNYGYAKKLPWRRSLSAMVVIGLIIAGFYSYEYRVPIAVRGNRLWLEHICATYCKPPDFRVYEEDPVVARQLLASNSGYDTIGVATNEGSTVDPTSVGCGPFDPLVALWGKWHANAVVFLHRRYTPGGEARLVLVETNLDSFNVERRTLAFYTISRTFLPFFGHNVVEGDEKIYWVELRKEDCVRIFAGQPSKEDGKFSFRYELNGQPGTIEGVLESDGTTTLFVKSGPLKCKKAGT